MADDLAGMAAVLFEAGEHDVPVGVPDRLGQPEGMTLTAWPGLARVCMPVRRRWIPGADVAAIAGAYGVEVIKCTDREALDAVLAEVGRPGVRVAVVPSDRAANVVAHDRLHAAVAEAVEAVIAGA